MRVNILVLVSVILTVVQITHTYRVAAKNGLNRPQKHPNYGLQDNLLDKVNSLDDLLYLAENNDGQDIFDPLAATDSSELLESKVKPSLADYEYSAELGTDADSLLSNPIFDEEELESHSSLVGGQGHQYVSGGAGEGKQHLQPDGAIDNKEEVKSDEDLPAYCDPPNPCPVGVRADDCDPRPYSIFNAQFSKEYQEQQNCMCDDDHNECHKRSKPTGASNRVSDLINNLNQQLTQVVAKKSPRVRRDIGTDQNQTKRKLNPYLRGEAIKIHVAKKSTTF